MNTPSGALKIDGQVANPAHLTVDEIASLPAACQVLDVRRYGAKRPGDAVTLRGLLAVVGPLPEADYLGLHSATDNFHASIPLRPVLDRALLIYRCDNQPLDTAAGGPFRFFVPDHAACHTDEIDECANVKFLDHLELTIGKGYDNRPTDDAEHAKLHEGE